MVKPVSNLVPETPFGAAAQAIISRLFEQLMKNLPGTRLGEDIEALHDMRVASRRMRAAFRVFMLCLPRKERRKVVSEVQGVTRALGGVRDLDVFLEFLAEYAESSGADIAWLIESERTVREEARVQLISALDELEAGGLPKSIDALLACTAMTESSGKKRKGNRFFVQAPSLVIPSLGELLVLSRYMDDPERVSELHQMRIAAKRLRYTMEAFVPCFGKPLQAQIEEVKLLQEQLGQVHDCDVWVGKLEEYASKPGLQPAQLRALEDIIGERRTHRARMYHQALQHWQGLVEKGFAANLMALVSSKPAAAGPEL